MSPEMIKLILQATFESLFMVSIAALLGTVFGLPIGVFLATSRKGELFAAPAVNAVLGMVVNATRSTPFIILVVAIIPFTRESEDKPGQRLGDQHLEDGLEWRGAKRGRCLDQPGINLADRGFDEARDERRRGDRQRHDRRRRSNRGTRNQPLAVVSLLGYSAMVGAVGGGDLGIRYGYRRFMPEMMLAVVAVLIALVQAVQSAGDYLARRVNRRLRHR